MVLPSPFERLLQQTMLLAQSDREAAFAALDDLYGKTLTESDLQQLGGFAVHLGAATMGRFAQTSAFLRRLLSHPVLSADGHTARSLWRALAVVHILADQPAEAREASSHGATTPAEECRLAIGAAQVLAARGKLVEVIGQLRQVALLCRDLEPEEEVRALVATTTAQLLRQAEPQARLAQDLLLATAAAHRAALSRHPDWHLHHTAWFQQGHAYLLAGRPAQTLQCVQAMMELEDLHDAGPYERFHTASLACRAQAVRGQFKIAGGALEACQDFAKRLSSPEQTRVVQGALQELQAFVDNARSA